MAELSPLRPAVVICPHQANAGAMAMSEERPGVEVARVTSVALRELIRLAKEGGEHMLAYLLEMALSECDAILGDSPRAALN